VTATGRRTVAELLGAPRGMGSATAHRLAEHLDLDPGVAVVDLDAEQVAGLCAGLRQAAGGLPDGR
jgi:hypothetical protein